MSDLAPWESSGSKQPFHPDAPTEKVPRRAPGRLPEIYKRQTEAFIAPPGNVVPRPQQTPRPLEPRALYAIYALIAMAVLGLGWSGLVFVIFSAEAGAIRFAYAAVGLLLAITGVAVLLIEMPRINRYRTGHFIPGVLVYGARINFDKVLGPAGVGSVTAQLARGTGEGLLSKVFDRSSHKTAPPEIVALHVNRGNGPEMIGIEWEAVRELQRGDIVWFQLINPQTLLMFHKLIPYAPWVSQDEATRKEVFAALRVGDNMFKDRVDAKNMGTTKVFHTDADGNLQAGGAPPHSPQPHQGENTKQLGLTSRGGMLGGDEQYNQQDDYAVDPQQSHDNTHRYRIGQEGASFADYDQPEQGDTYE
ncbi:MAG: hypothetical protein K8I27_01455 [Planctomycetes bacterium]|nr:hypothetical protein [Planctomycetota bacterium]